MVAAGVPKVICMELFALPGEFHKNRVCYAEFTN